MSEFPEVVTEAAIGAKLREAVALHVRGQLAPARRS